ncbi:unnamed protein product [Peniophora sp. CBMAI 1063]|nr:unnamed protein product [Peniophora sp. CBMAI 1063]
MTSNRPTHSTSYSFAGLPSATFRDFDEDDLATPTQSTWHRRSRTTVEIPIDVPLTSHPNSQLPKHMLLSYMKWIEDLSASLQARLRAEEADVADLEAYKNMMELEVEEGTSRQWRTLLMRMLPGAKDLNDAMETFNEILEKKHDLLVVTSARAAHSRMRAYEAREQLEKALIAARKELESLQTPEFAM